MSGVNRLEGKKEKSTSSQLLLTILPFQMFTSCFLKKGGDL
jgi:hypothetical protein